MRKSLLIALLFAFALPMTANRAEAQFSLLPYIGYNLDAEAFLVGIGAEFEAPFSAGSYALGFRPSVEYVFVDSPPDQTVAGTTISSSITALQINGDLIARLNASGFNPFVGAGLAIAYASASVDCSGSFCDDFDSASNSATDLGINVLGGLEFPGALGFGDPYVQGRITFADGTAISILGGLSIPLGQN